MNTQISLLITTYNHPARLRKIISHYLRQRPQPLEIIICDDGSTPAIKELVEQMAERSRTPLRHVYQPDNGWDAPGIRNHGAVSARGNYLVMTDGDCLPHPKFIQDHLHAAQSGHFVFGERSHVVEEHAYGFSTRLDVRLVYMIRGWIKKRSAVLRLPFESPAAYERAAFATLNQLRGVALGCNFGLWKKDFTQANGFDESFRSWWPEDAELSARLLNSGLRMKKHRRKCLVYHLDHGHQPSANGEAILLAERSLNGGITKTANGLRERSARSTFQTLGTPE